MEIKLFKPVDTLHSIYIYLKMYIYLLKISLEHFFVYLDRLLYIYIYFYIFVSCFMFQAIRDGVIEAVLGRIIFNLLKCI